MQVNVNFKCLGVIVLLIFKQIWGQYSNVFLLSVAVFNVKIHIIGRLRNRRKPQLQRALAHSR